MATKKATKKKAAPVKKATTKTPTFKVTRSSMAFLNLNDFEKGFHSTLKKGVVKGNKNIIHTANIIAITHAIAKQSKSKTEIELMKKLQDSVSKYEFVYLG